MALINCKECGNSISNTAKSCPNCGAKNKKTGIFTKIFSGFLALAIIGGISRSCSESYSKYTGAADLASEKVRIASLPPEQRLAEEKKLKDQEQAEIESNNQQLGQKWDYQENQDEMGLGTIKMAKVNSLNTFELKFPYSGIQRATLALRSHPKFGKDVILKVEKGQFLCGFDGCSVDIKFDNGKPKRFWASNPKDHNTATLFIDNYSQFFNEVKKSKKAYIQAQFYQEGSMVFQFDVSDLDWK